MIQIAPNELTFTFTSIAPIRAFVSIKNKTSGLIAFKVKSTVTEQFDVSPNIGELKPNQIRNIEFKTMQVYEKSPGLELLSQARFLVQCTQISRAGQGQNDNTWKDKSRIQNNKLKVKWQGFEVREAVQQMEPMSLQQTFQEVRKQIPVFSPPPQKSLSISKPKKYNRIIAVILLFTLGIIFGYGLRWYNNYRNRISEFNKLNQNIKITPESKFGKIVQTPDLQQYTVLFAHQLYDTDRQYRIHIDKDDKPTIIQL